MASIGLYIDLSEKVKDATKVEKVRQVVLKRFNMDSNNDIKHRVDIYRMTPLRSHEEISASDTLVAHVPESQLDASTIEHLIHESESLKRTVSELNSEMANLKQRLTHSEAIRTEAVQTIDLLRTEFLSLLEDVNRKRSFLPEPSTELYSARSARLTQRNKGAGRPAFNNSRH